MEKPNESFIQQTAMDYDMTIDEVNHIWKHCTHPNEFYEQLEEFILSRSDG